jgi:hypothetical protein
MKVIIGTTLSMLAAFGIVVAVRANGKPLRLGERFTVADNTAPPPPKTITREYQEQSTEYLRNQNANPIVRFCLYLRVYCAYNPVRSLVGRLQRKGNGPVVIWTLDVVRVVVWLRIMKTNTHCRVYRPSIVY